MKKPTMSPEYRSELRDLRRSRKKVLGDEKREIVTCEKLRKKMNKTLDLRIRRASSASGNWIRTIDRRIMILEGRLS